MPRLSPRIRVWEWTWIANSRSCRLGYPSGCFFATHDGHVVADLIDPHGHYLADTLPKLRGLALYAATHGSSYRRIESIVKIGEQFRALDLTREDVREAIASSTDVASLYSGPLANDYGL